jgi:hypothetical protein
MDTIFKEFTEAKLTVNAHVPSFRPGTEGQVIFLLGWAIQSKDNPWRYIVLSISR